MRNHDYDNPYKKYKILVDIIKKTITMLNIALRKVAENKNLAAK